MDECTSTAGERQQVYVKAAQYYYQGSSDLRAAIHNKTRTFIDRLSGFFYQPSNVRFNVLFDSSEPVEILQQGRSASQMLTAEYRSCDADLRFSDAVTWSLVCGTYFLKHLGEGYGFKVVPVHPSNIGVLSETLVSLDEQECIVHVSYPTITQLRSMLH